MRNGKIENIKLDNANVMYRNFAGRVTDYNKNGDRVFSIRLDDNEFDVSKAREDGWNIKTKVRPDGTEYNLLEVKVDTKNEYYPVNVYTQIPGQRKKELDDNRLGMLDHAKVKQWIADVRPYEWNVSGRSGVKAYLENMIAILDIDDFDLKYGFKGVDTDGDLDDDNDMPF